MKVLCLLLQLFLLNFVSSEISFAYNGFLQSNLTLDGAAYLRSDGILAIKNDSTKLLGHAFYSYPLPFRRIKPKSNQSFVVDFSTNFIFSITPKYPDLGGHGLAFVLIPTKEPRGCLPNQFLGLPDNTSISKFDTDFLAVEFDTVQNPELSDINDNHVGIDISSLISNASAPAAYFTDNAITNNQSISLKSGNAIFNKKKKKSGNAIQAWIDYDSQEMLINISISPMGILSNSTPFCSFFSHCFYVLIQYSCASH